MTALDKAKEFNYPEIVDLLTNGPRETIETTDQSRVEYETIKQDKELLLEKTQEQEETINQLQQKNCEQAEEINKLKSYLFALKEKVKDIEFFEISEYEEIAVIEEGSTSSIKNVIKKEKGKYVKKEMKNFTHEMLQRFLLESEILFKLRHPCIVRIFGFNNGDETHPPSIVISHEPKSLESAIKDGELDESLKNRITVELVLGMRYIHEHKFMHRNLKPSNILLSKNRHVRISDFGLSKEESHESSQTKGIGALQFMAPELFEDNNDSYTNKVDVYSFGITLIFIITDKYPTFSMRNAVMDVIPQLPSSVVNWVRELIARCLSQSPENRPSFAQIFEIMKSNNYDMFNENIPQSLTTRQQRMKKLIEERILKIEAFEYQHQQQ